MTKTASPAPALLKSLRIVALALGLGTVAFLSVAGDWRADNAFLAPDLALAIGLVIGALIPGERAVPVLLLAFGYAAGVLGAAAMTYVVAGRFGPGASTGFVVALIASMILLKMTWAARP